MTCIVSDDESLDELLAHAGVIHCHEDRVDDDAECDEQIDESIHDEQLDNASKLVPASAAFPIEEQLEASLLHRLLPIQLLRHMKHGQTWNSHIPHKSVLYKLFNIVG